VIPYSRQRISQADLRAVNEALSSEFLTQGPRVVSFERALARRVGAKYSVAVNSATSALHLACLAIGVGEGDLVWTSAISFVASANAARYCGAEVDFVDIEISSFNLSIKSLKSKLEERAASGKKLPKVLVVVHMAGQPTNMSEVHELSLKYGFKIIEDASHALGSSYKGYLTGSCEFSDVTVFSFHPVKMITTGEGGVCLTNDAELFAKIQRLRSHGITRDINEMQNDYPGGWYYEQLDLGYNYRMTDFQAALGESQLESLGFFVEDRNRIAHWYEENLVDAQVALPKIASNVVSSFHLYIVLFQNSQLRKEAFERLRSMGILVNVHYLPIYRHPYYKNMNLYNPLDYPVAEDYYSRCLSIPIFPGLEELDLTQVAKGIKGSIGHQTIF
jgi:UDP-4-amino-4,6-dideoxy-N-acetyl-beta-L-altrosamine transaminase